MENAQKAILSELLSEFKERKLKADDLRHGYEGMAPALLKQTCLAKGISDVDYDLAYREAFHKSFVQSGPRVPYENDPSSGVLIVGLRSLNKFTYLTEKGYKEASKPGPIRSNKASSSSVHISGNHFHNSPVGIGSNISQSVIASVQASNDVFAKFREEVGKSVEDHDQREEILKRVDELESANDKPSRLEKYAYLVGTLGDHITVLGFMLPLIYQAISQ